MFAPREIIWRWKCSTEHPSPPLELLYSKLSAGDAAKSVHHWMFTLCVIQTKVCFQKNSALHHDTWLALENYCCPALHREKVRQSKPGWGHPPWAISITFPSPPQQHGCSEDHDEKIPPLFGWKKRKQLSRRGKDSYYLLFKSGVISGHRSMRKGNFQAERIWTLEIFVEKWCLPVPFAIGAQTHPATPGRHQKDPFCAAQQRKAGCPGGA